MRLKSARVIVIRLVGVVCLFLPAGVLATIRYETVLLTYNESYSLFSIGSGGFTDYFTSNPQTFSTLPGVPFAVAVKTDALHALSTTLPGPEAFTIDIDDVRADTVYVLGTGTFLAPAFGHQALWCNELAHFSFVLNPDPRVTVEVS